MNELVVMPSGNLAVDDTFLKIRDVEAAIDALKEQEQKKARERKELEAKVDAAKSIIKTFMSDNGLVEIEGNVVKYKLSKANPKLVIENEALISDEYKEQTIVTTIRKDAIKDQLKMGDVIAGCYLEENFALKVGVK